MIEQAFHPFYCFVPGCKEECCLANVLFPSPASLSYKAATPYIPSTAVEEEWTINWQPHDFREQINLQRK